MRFDAIIDGLSEAIEPIMLFMIAGMVILLALGIFLPMWSMGDAVQGRH
jgi:general secretion pathway protein F